MNSDCQRVRRIFGIQPGQMGDYFGVRGKDRWDGTRRSIVGVVIEASAPGRTPCPSCARNTSFHVLLRSHSSMERLVRLGSASGSA